MTPHQRLAGSVDASRPCPGSAELRAAFRITRKRTLRRSDGTVSVVYPLDKRGNADGVRRPAGPGGDEGGGAGAEAQLPPLLKGILDEQAASGLPPAWLPHRNTPGPGKDDDRGDAS